MSKFIKTTEIAGEPAVKQFAKWIENFEKNEVALERAKVQVGFMRQYYNNSRLVLKAFLTGV